MHSKSVAAGVMILLAALATMGRAADSGKIVFVEEKLANGLRVIYAPLDSSPVVHVRVLYHVGSKDERPDRQGFAHMFEHMMFRGSAHVKPEQHMRLIQTVGGSSNAYTSMDETVYVNTVPSQHLEMALWLEADRMAGFKVSDEILKTERNVVAEEWRLSYANRPYGTMYQELMKAAFSTHSYRWTTIGDMDQLKAAEAPELQAFFDRYYVPNNAVLVIAGKIDVPAAKAMARKYYAWIPSGAEVKREIPAEPPQTEPKRVEAPMAVPLYRIQQGYKIPPAKSPDLPALDMLSSILSGGRSGRLDVRLVSGKNPLCADVSAGVWGLEDGGLLLISATVLRGQDPAEVEKELAAAIAEARDRGVTDAELARAKTQARVGFIKGRETASDIAGQLGNAALIMGDANWANEEMTKIEAVTTADIQRVARTYLMETNLTTIVARPSAVPAAGATRPATAPAEAVGKSSAREVTFPADYPTTPPMNAEVRLIEFAKGVERDINGVKVIVMSDRRLPIVNWSLTMRRGGDIEPAGKDGLARLTAELVRHGTRSMDYETLNRELESRGLSVGLFDGGDYTRLSGSGPSEQAEYGIARSREMLVEPALDEAEFRKVREQMINGLLRSEEDPRSVAQNELIALLYPGSPLGRSATPRSVAGIELAEVRTFQAAIHRPNDAILVISGDVTVEKGEELARAMLAGWEKGASLPEAAAYPRVDAVRQRPRILLVDRPEGKQASIRAGLRAYTIKSEDKYAGSLVNQILSSGIDSRLGRAIRAERGLAYGVSMVFQPGRHDGVFAGGSETKVPSTAELLKVMGDVFEKMKTEPVGDRELAETKLRVAGSMAMQMQTIGQQAGYRVDGILNGYPVDYYDTYPARVAEVTAAQIQDVMKKYVRQNEMVIVVVAPAAEVKQSLEEIGDVTVVPMPAKRGAAATRPAEAKPAA